MKNTPGLSLIQAWALLAITLGVVTVCGFAIIMAPPWSMNEGEIVSAVNAVNNPVFDGIAHSVNILFGNICAFAITMVVAAASAVIRRSWRFGVATLIIIGVPWVFAAMIKSLVGRPRPLPTALMHASGIDPLTSSYPSGHTAFAAALTVALVLIAARRFRPALFVIACIVVIITAWSRMYLGVHYPTDVLASMVLVPPCAIALQRISAPLTRPRPPRSPRHEVTGGTSPAGVLR